MANIINGHTKTKLQNFSVETVRNLLNIDNKGIAKLCAQISLMPKKDQQGRTYFSLEDVETLRRLKNQNEQSLKIRRNTKKSYATVPIKQGGNLNNIHITEPPVNTPVKMPVANNSSTNAVEKICSSIFAMENSLTGKISEMIEKKLDEKLDGMDEVVVELVRCKTENETLRYKMNELNKELYNLKNELSRYKSLGFGFYVKNSSDSSLL